LCGRFDFLLDESGQPKLLEFNADGALTLLETAIIQRDWHRDLMPGAGQFNGLHDALVKAWQNSGHAKVHCAWRPRHPEIEGSIRYMARVIREAGLDRHLEALHCMGWDRSSHCFVDSDGNAIEACYKLYPWAWMLEEPFSQHVGHSNCQFIEPAWSHLLVSKATLALLWELFPDHPAVLPCHLHASKLPDSFVSKPFFGREGQNITIHRKGRIIAQSGGDFADSHCIHQQYVSSPRFDGFTPQFGVWMVNDHAVAVGIRESQRDIIDNNSAFVPHLISAVGHVTKEIIA
jgi:glutathionylspermidine synthase